MHVATTCLSDKKKHKKPHKIASNLHILFKLLSDAVGVKGILCRCVTYHSLLSGNHYLWPQQHLTRIWTKCVNLKQFYRVFWVFCLPDRSYRHVLYRAKLSVNWLIFNKIDEKIPNTTFWILAGISFGHNFESFDHFPFAIKKILHWFLRNLASFFIIWRKKLGSKIFWQVAIFYQLSIKLYLGIFDGKYHGKFRN